MIMMNHNNDNIIIIIIIITQGDQGAHEDGVGRFGAAPSSCITIQYNNMINMIMMMIMIRIARHLEEMCS
jgi:hypothetical protein